jgi:hypothetical protein
MGEMWTWGGGGEDEYPLREKGFKRGQAERGRLFTSLAEPYNFLAVPATGRK